MGRVDVPSGLLDHDLLSLCPDHSVTVDSEIAASELFRHGIPLQHYKGGVRPIFLLPQNKPFEPVSCCVPASKLL